MKLVDLNPRWVDAGGEGVRVAATGEPVPHRTGVALSFDCPCGCAQRIGIHVNPPLDGGSPISDHNWVRTGDDFATLTLRPSIQRVGGCEWHGFITNGEAVNA